TARQDRAAPPPPASPRRALLHGGRTRTFRGSVTEAANPAGPMVLVIDNYDSFTWNLVQLLGDLGAEPVVRRNDELDLDGIAALAPERIVISPGPCTPAEAGISVDCVRRFAGAVPILGVCLGHQAIGAAFGAAI